MEECAASARWPVTVPAPALRIASCDAPPASEEEELRLDSSKPPPLQFTDCLDLVNGVEFHFHCFWDLSQYVVAFSVTHAEIPLRVVV